MNLSEGHTEGVFCRSATSIWGRHAQGREPRGLKNTILPSDPERRPDRNGKLAFRPWVGRKNNDSLGSLLELASQSSSQGTGLGHFLHFLNAWPELT